MADWSTNPIPRACKLCRTPFITRARTKFYCCKFCSAKATFERFVIRRGIDECWDWSGFKYNGYGRMNHALGGGGSIGAHRMSYILHNGLIPDEMTVLHRCDNPPCTNPTHLLLGTNKDNNKDRDAKGRQAVGERIGTAHLNATKVREMRKVYADGQLSMRKVAAQFGANENTVMAVLSKKTWKHLT